MAQTYGGGFIVVTATGVSAATGAASARSPIPNNGAGQKPKYILVSARNECYVKLGDSSVTATGNDLLIQPADSRIIHVPAGYTHIAYIQGTAAGQVNIAPLDNQ